MARRVVRRVVFDLARLGKIVLIPGDLFGVRLLTRGKLFGRELGTGAELRRTGKRHADRIVAGISALQVWIAPWRPRHRLAATARLCRGDRLRRRDGKYDCQSGEAV